MQRYGLAAATLATFLVTGLTLQGAGWFSPRSTHMRSTHSANSQTSIKDERVMSIPAYYRQAGPRHWRDCMGQN